MKIYFKLPLLCTLVFLFQTCKTEDENKPVAEPQKPLLITHLDLSGALAVFLHKYPGEMYKVDASKNVSKVAITHEGGTDNYLDKFDIFKVNEKYFILSSNELQQTYFIDKSDGKAYKTKYFEMDYFIGPEQIVCTNDECYFMKGQTIHQITNFRSEDAEIKSLEIKNIYDLFMDKDNNLFYYVVNSGIYFYSSASSVNVVTKFSGRWKGLDGYFHIIDSQGNVSKVSKNGITLEGTIPNSVSSIGGFVFPTLNKEWGFQYKYNLYMLWNINSPFNASQTYAGPQVTVDFPEYRVLASNAGKYLNIISTAAGAYQTYRRIDVTDLSSTLVTTASKDKVGGIYALRDDIVLVKICVSENFGCRDQLAFIGADGTLDFLFTSGNVMDEVIKF